MNKSQHLPNSNTGLQFSWLMNTSVFTVSCNANALKARPLGDQYMVFFQKSSKTVILAFCQMNPFDSDIFISLAVMLLAAIITGIWEKKEQEKCFRHLS